MGHSADGAVHKIPHKMKTYWQNHAAENFSMGLI